MIIYNDPLRIKSLIKTQKSLFLTNYNLNEQLIHTLRSLKKK